MTTTQQLRSHDFWVLQDPWPNEFCVLQTTSPDLLDQRSPGIAWDWSAHQRRRFVAGFLQLVAFTTARIDEVNTLADQMRDRKGSATGLVRRGAFTSDRDRPDHYVSIIEFDSYDLAVANAKSSGNDSLRF